MSKPCIAGLSHVLQLHAARTCAHASAMHQHTSCIHHTFRPSDCDHTSKRSTKNRQEGQRFQFSVLANACTYVVKQSVNATLAVHCDATKLATHHTATMLAMPTLASTNGDTCKWLLMHLQDRACSLKASLDKAILAS